MENTNSNRPGVDRRTFVKGISAAGIGLALSSGSVLAQPAAESRKRFAHIGLGGRSRLYLNAMLKDYKDSAQLVGLCDKNPGRLGLAQKLAADNGTANVPGFGPADFERMIRETRPSVVIVTTVDATHDDFIVRALEAGCDVITEKPMTTTAEKCQRIIDAKKRTGKNVRVTFNYRYAPMRTQVKDILMSGEIGEVLSVDFHWLLNTHHGADYFRRWHAYKASSGGLMVHKATHHFDLVNWWLGAVPVTVYGSGKREYYTPATAKRIGLTGAHQRCHTCPEKEKCNFFLDLSATPALKEMYLDQEHHDGYFRDQCVFRPDIDIEDTMNVVVKYDTGATLSYSLNAFNAWEGYHVAFNGTKGRVEHSMVEQVYDTVEPLTQIRRGATTTRVIPLRGTPKDIETWTGTGSHAGGDKVMLDEIFLPSAPADKYQRASDERGGAYSCLIGAAANRSFVSGQAVQIAEMVTGLTRPAFAPMPGRDLPLPMPPKAGRAPEV